MGKEKQRHTKDKRKCKILHKKQAKGDDHLPNKIDWIGIFKPLEQQQLLKLTSSVQHKMEHKQDHLLLSSHCFQNKYIFGEGGSNFTRETTFDTVARQCLLKL